MARRRLSPDLDFTSRYDFDPTEAPPGQMQNMTGPPQDGTPPPDQDPTGQNPDPGGGNTGVPWGTHDGGDFFQQIMDAIKASAPNNSAQYMDQLMANRTKLLPLIQAAQKAWGNAGILGGLKTNPMKGLYTMLSYLTGTPYYDRTGDGSMGNLFKVPGFDYGTIDDNWAGQGTYGTWNDETGWDTSKKSQGYWT